MRHTPYVFHSDPSHGWLEVPTALVRTVGLIPSACSFLANGGRTCLLEEDCDASAFMRLLTAHNPFAAKHLTDTLTHRSYNQRAPIIGNWYRLDPLAFDGITSHAVLTGQKGN